MSNLPSIDSVSLETVTGGTGSTSTCTSKALGSLGGDTSSLASQLQAITTSLKDIGNVKKNSGFSDSTMLMLAFMATNRPSSNNVVVVHRGWW